MNFINSLKSKIKFFNRFVWLTGMFSIYKFAKEFPSDFYGKNFKTKNQIKILKEKYGDGWVIITGATSGIGLSFTQELAKIGFNTLLISRDEEKLNKVCSDINRKFNVISKKIVYNFQNDFDETSIEKLKNEINNKIGQDKVSIVINNVGVQFLSDKKFDLVSPRELITYVKVNILSQLIMYHICLPNMKAQDGKSLFLDVSSLSNDVDVMAVNPVYQATKTFNARFSQLMKRQLDIQRRVGDKNNVDVALFKPGMTVSNLTVRHNTKNLISDYADNVVINCLYDIAGGSEETRGSFRHEFIYMALKFIPKFVREQYIATTIYKGYNKENTKF